MIKEKKSLLLKYAVCFGIAALITVGVFAAKGFFTDSASVNLQILSDGFSVSGILITLFAGLLFVSGEGAFIGIGFVLRNVVQAFVPMGRRHHEFYAQYRERKLGKLKKQEDHCVLFTGLFFLIIGITLTVIWYQVYYQPPA